jgi:hypothetical protein
MRAKSSKLVPARATGSRCLLSEVGARSSGSVGKLPTHAFKARTPSIKGMLGQC